MASSFVTKINSSFAVLDLIEPERAIALLVTDRAWTFETVPGKIVRGPSRTLAWPRSIVLTKWADVPYTSAMSSSDVNATRMGVLRRDNHKCGYCGNDADTWDHIQPQSRGGEDTWLNTIAACVWCNSRKGNSTLEEIGKWSPEKLREKGLNAPLKLLWHPYVPDKGKHIKKEQDRINRLLMRPEGLDEPLTSDVDSES
jgi:5-methylcytosine-specific restriction endonuclease McrA